MCFLNVTSNWEIHDFSSVDIKYLEIHKEVNVRFTWSNLQPQVGLSLLKQGKWQRNIIIFHSTLLTDSVVIYSQKLCRDAASTSGSPDHTRTEKKTRLVNLTVFTIVLTFFFPLCCAALLGETWVSHFVSSLTRNAWAALWKVFVSARCTAIVPFKSSKANISVHTHHRNNRIIKDTAERAETGSLGCFPAEIRIVRC